MLAAGAADCQIRALMGGIVVYDLRVVLDEVCAASGKLAIAKDPPIVRNDAARIAKTALEFIGEASSVDHCQISSGLLDIEGSREQSGKCTTSLVVGACGLNLTSGVYYSDLD